MNLNDSDWRAQFSACGLGPLRNLLPSCKAFIGDEILQARFVNSDRILTGCTRQRRL